MIKGIKKSTLTLFIAAVLIFGAIIPAQAQDNVEALAEIVQQYVRTYPIYRVYKNGVELNVDAELQWFIRDLAEEHGYCERIIFGLIIEESTFNNDALAACGNGRGLAQITRWWLRSPALLPYRLDSEHRNRDLLNPYENLITLIEKWNYGRSAYQLNMDCDYDWSKLLRWHNTGGMPNVVSNWSYVSRIRGFANELVELELPTGVELVVLVELMALAEMTN